jgi:hypothetical protein
VLETERRPELSRWPPEVERLARHLSDLDLRADLACNPARREMLRLEANRLEAIKAAQLAREFPTGPPAPPAPRRWR